MLWLTISHLLALKWLKINVQQTYVARYNGTAVPLQACSGPEGSRKLRFPDYMTVAQDGGKIVSLMHRALLPPWNAPGTHFCHRLSRPQGHSATRRILCQWKIQVTPPGIEPATFWFVAQHRNHCTYSKVYCQWKSWLTLSCYINSVIFVAGWIIVTVSFFCGLVVKMC